jgi:RNA recognition motif-containing protein
LKDNKKQQSNSSNSYAFIQFSDIRSVIKAMRCMSGKCIGNNPIKLGFGKSKPTRVLWLDGVSEQLRDTYLLDYFKSYCENNVHQALIDRLKGQALVYFGTIEDAKMCADKIRAKRFYDKRVMVDFASKEFISSRFEHLLDPKHHLLINQRPQADGKDRKLAARTAATAWSGRQRSHSPLSRSPGQRSRTTSLNNEVHFKDDIFQCCFL